jgi:hypothetical protein
MYSRESICRLFNCSTHPVNLHQHLLVLLRTAPLFLCFSHDAFAVNRIDIHIGTIQHPAAQIENVNVTLNTDGRWQGRAAFNQAHAAELAKLLPNDHKLPVSFSKGTLDGKAEFSGKWNNLQQLNADIGLRDIAFSDTEGLHAGEKLGAQININAVHTDARWQWQTEARWQTGEIFWQPLYLPAGHSLKVSGTLLDDNLTVTQGRANLQGIGEATFSGIIHLADKRIQQLKLDAQGLQAGRGYELLAKPFLEKSLLGNIEVAGSVDLHAQLGAQGTERLAITLRDVDLEDKSNRFAFYKVNASIPWVVDQATQAEVSYAGGTLLHLPLGAANLSAKLDGYSLTTPKLQIPLLDGVLTVQEVSAARVADRWHWHLRADLSPIALPEFSHAMGWPRMDGKISASIPQVTYSNGKLSTDGTIALRAFDGTVNIAHLAMQEPLGLAPRLSANLEMRNLDMELLTRTFSFGMITGRLDGDVSGLELSSWQPVKFDASFRSSPGDYRRKISQRAVENISALGGAGAAAAIQRSVLHFFNEFNYQRIGLSCKLRNGICQMDGVEPAEQGYVMIKGSGVPAITVLGYNRTVSWNELLERVQHIIQGNTKAIIK